ncbi:MAG: putative porin [Woeseiaceae bacterium]|nr:putative porin [Woeseiaceae bacterium]
MKIHASTIGGGLIALAMMLGLAAPAAAENDVPDWISRISFYGDLRLRHEDIYTEGDPGANRDRERGRARIGLSAEVNDSVKLVFGLATGGDNPVSRNVTGDGGFTTKEIGIELFYADWTVNDNLNVFAGKMKNNLFRAGGSPLIWDGDLNLEGAALTYTNGWFFTNVGAYSVEERSGEDDSQLYTAQFGGEFSVGDGAKLTTGVGVFGYTNTIGNEPFYNGNPRGNTVDINGNYIFDYRNVEAFAQYDMKAGSLPLSLFGHYTVNTEVDREDTAYAFGAKLGAAKNKGEWEASWTYQDIEADAVIGTFNDSDFGGGGTDSEGHMIKAKYALGKNVALGSTFFLNKIDEFQGTETDFNRIQLDLEFKFK